MTKSYDIVVVGSGFAGSLMAMIARRLGRSVALIERGSHPRVVIGESSTPLTNLLLEELTGRYDLPNLRPLCKWGTWQASHPEIACGLKRGFTFYHHHLGEHASSLDDRSKQLLVAASPHDSIADTHWYRADFDHLFVHEAEALGVDYYDHTQLKNFGIADQGAELRGSRGGKSIEFRAAFVIDASGPRGLLHKLLDLRELDLPRYPGTQALYSHFSEVGRIADQVVHEEVPPYPVDDAAVHHVFDGGWIWVLQFNNGITSAGVACTDEFAVELGLTDGETAWKRLLQQMPTLQKQFEHAKALRPFTHIPQLSFRSASVVGKQWALLPSAAGFVDPLLSTGFPLTLLGVSRLAEIFGDSWDREDFHPRLLEYEATTSADVLATSDLIAALYASMGNFDLFRALSLVYFATVSYSETARRLDRSYLAGSFLLREHPEFGPASRRIVDQVLRGVAARDTQAIVEEIERTIAPIDIAGLRRRERRNWFPVESSDLLEGAHKLGVSQDEIEHLLERSGFYAASSLKPNLVRSVP